MNVLSVILSVCPLDSVQLRIRAVKFCTETRRWAARPYRTVLVSESASTVLYRTVTIRCTVSDTSTSIVVVSDLPNVTDLPKVAGCGTGMDIEMDKEMDNEP